MTNLKAVEFDYEDLKIGTAVLRPDDEMAYNKILDRLYESCLDDHDVLVRIDLYEGDFKKLLFEVGLYEEFAMKWGVYNYDKATEMGVMINNDANINYFGKYLTYQQLQHQAQKRAIQKNRDFMKTKVALVCLHTMFFEFVRDLIEIYNHEKFKVCIDTDISAVLEFLENETNFQWDTLSFTKEELIFIEVEREILLYRNGIVSEEYYDLIPEKTRESQKIALGENLNIDHETVVQYIDKYKGFGEELVRLLEQ